MNNFCSIFSKKLLKNCLVFFVVPAILLVACGAPNEDSSDNGKPVTKLPAESAPKSWDKAFEHMLTALHAPYTDGDCFFKAGPVHAGVAAGTPNVMKIMGKNLVVDSNGTFKVPSKGSGSFSITTVGIAAGAIKVAVNTAGDAVTSGVLIEYKDFQPAGSNVKINGKIGLNGVASAADSSLAMFAVITNLAPTHPEPANGGTLKITGPGYKAELSFAKVAAREAASQTISSLVVKGAGKACAAGAGAATENEPFSGAAAAGAANTGAFAKVGGALTDERIIVKFKFNNETKILVGIGNDDKGQDLLKKFVKVSKSAPVAPAA